MDDEKVQVLVGAFPVDEFEREKLRKMVPHVPLPAVYPDAVNLPCSGCGMILSVGPRSQQMLKERPEAQLICPWCMPRGEHVSIKSLGNPESKSESPWS
jgi:hypothetical protein